jgi:hypothetical protein
MNLKALYSLSYGVYMVSSKDEGRINGQIANAVMQISSDPSTIAVSINIIEFLQIIIQILHLLSPLIKVFWSDQHQFFSCQVPAFHQPHSLPANGFFNQVAHQAGIPFIFTP